MTSGSVIRVGGGGVGDDAVDVTYSTKPNNNIVLRAGALTTTTTTTTTTERYGMGMGLGQISGEETTVSATGNVMSVGGGAGDEAVDVTYSTKQDNGEIRIGMGEISRIATNTISTTGEELNNLKIYNRATILQDKVQHIIQREIQPIIKTVIKPIIQREIQPIVQREIQQITQHEIQPVVEREIQPVIQREIQPIVKKEI